MSETRAPKIVFASANVADPRAGWKRFFIRPEAIGDLAQQAGYDGVEYMPAFDWLWLATPRAVARAVRQKRLDLYSLHATFRTTERSADTNVPTELRGRGSLAERLLASKLGRVVMREVIDSSLPIASIRREVPRELPAVLFPQRDPELDRLTRERAGEGPKLIQATDYVARQWGVTTPEEFAAQVTERGYDGIVLDTTHASRFRYPGAELPRVISDLDRSLPALANLVRGIHLGLGRSDVAAPFSLLRFDTNRDLDVALSGGDYDKASWTTATVMSAARDGEFQNLEYVAVEAQAARLGPSMVEEYRLIADGLRGYLAPSPEAAPVSL